MPELENLLRASISLEASRQAIKTFIALGKQQLATLTPSATCNPIIAEDMRADREIWESAIAAGEKALKPVEAVRSEIRAEDVIPDFICKTCKDPVPNTINGHCWKCWDFIRQAQMGQETCSAGPRRIK